MLPGFSRAVDYSQEKHLDFSYFFRYFCLAQLRVEWARAQFQASALKCALLFWRLDFMQKQKSNERKTSSRYWDDSDWAIANAQMLSEQCPNQWVAIYNSRFISHEIYQAAKIKSFPARNRFRATYFWI
jgi:hypothetical protein